MKLLEGFTILDFSHRLPGPMGMNFLGHMGAKVYKIEDEIFKDAFYSGMFSDFDESFVDWYHELNDQKEILRFNFKSEATTSKLHEMIKKADGLLMALPPKVRQFLKLTDHDLKKINPELAIIEMGASTKHNYSMHDLNAMALTGMLSLYVHDKTENIVNPPFLPISGILFGQQLAGQLLAAILKAKKNKEFVNTIAYLFDTAQMVCNPLWSENLRAEKKVKFLHNGAYPCYSMYKTKDGHYVGVAAVEEKFWQDFIKIFKIEIEAKERFNTERRFFEKIAQKINPLTLQEVEAMIKGKDICVSLIEKLN